MAVGTPRGEVITFGADGTPLWRAQILGEVQSPPLVGRGLVIVRGSDFRLTAFDAETGRRRWTYQRATPPLTLRGPSELAFAGDFVVAGFPGGGPYRLEAARIRDTIDARGPDIFHRDQGTREVFSLYGEDYYRRLERDVLADLLEAAQPGVIAVGGGLVTASDTFALLRRHAVTVWLRARPVDYWNRVVKQGDQRPMKEHPQAREALRDLIARRDPLYRQADLTVDTAGLTVARTVNRVAAALDGSMG